MHPPHPSLDLLLPALITMSLTTTPTSRFSFSMMWGKFCHSCFEITARTAFAQFGYFTLKTRIPFQKAGFNRQIPLWVRHCTAQCIFKILKRLLQLVSSIQKSGCFPVSSRQKMTNGIELKNKCCCLNDSHNSVDFTLISGVSDS